MAAGFGGGAVSRAAVGDQDLNLRPARFEPGNAGRHAGKGRTERAGGVEGWNYDAKDGRHGADDGR